MENIPQETVLQKAADYFTKQGLKPQLHVKKFDVEFDLYAEKTGFFRDKYVVAECKDTVVTTEDEVDTFFQKVEALNKGLKSKYVGGVPIEAFLCYSGEVDEEAAYAAKTHKPAIKLLKFA